MAAPEPGPSLVLTWVAAAASPAGRDAPLRGSDLGRVDVQAPAAIAVVEGRIAAEPSSPEVREATRQVVPDKGQQHAVPGKQVLGVENA